MANFHEDWPKRKFPIDSNRTYDFVFHDGAQANAYGKRFMQREFNRLNKDYHVRVVTATTKANKKLGVKGGKVYQMYIRPRAKAEFLTYDSTKNL